MKNYKVLLSTALFSGTLALSAALYFNNTKLYQPRLSGLEENELEEQKEKAAAGSAQWFFDIRKNPTTGEISEADVIASREEVEQFQQRRSPNSPQALGLNWTELGPDNIGGRTRAILIDKRDASGQTMFAGSVSGGLYKSTNGGTNWSVIPGSDQQPILSIGCITQAANGDIYVGTGEDLYNGITGVPGGILGGGIFKSTDGITFTILQSTKPATANSTSNSPTNAFLGVNNIAADPFNANRIYAATRYGLQMTDDGGATWRHAILLGNGSNNTGRATDVDVASDGTVLASVSNKLYRSPNGDFNTYTLITGTTGAGLPTTGISRIEFAISPSDPNFMYAVAAKTNEQLHGVYQSVDKGLTWTTIGNGGSTLFNPISQGSFALSIAVFSGDKTRIIVGGLDNWIWKQSNSTSFGVGQWTKVSNWNVSGFPGYPFYVHADIHTYKFHPTNPNVFFVGTDGGVFRGFDAGTQLVFQPMNKGYNVTQYYSVAFAGDEPTGNAFVGGAQDNGTSWISGAGTVPKTGTEIGGGDGAECEISYLNPNVMFSTVYYGALKRHSSKGGDGNSFYPNKITSLTGFGTPSFASFVTPIALYETRTATNSTDSVLFINLPGGQILGVGNGINKRFTGTFNRPQPSASFVPNTFQITIGNITLTDNGTNGFTSVIPNVLTTTVTNSLDYATGAYDFTLRTAPAAGTSVNCSFDVSYAAGSNIKLERAEYVYPLYFNAPNTINPGDSVKVYDPFQVKLAVGFTGKVYITKGALDFSGTPKWFQIGTIAGTAEELAWTADGDVLFVGTGGGNLYRFSGMAGIKDSVTGDIASPSCVVVKTQIAGFGKALTGIAVDPNNNDNLVVTFGGYGGTAYVSYCSTAATCAAATNASNFTNKQGTGLTKLPAMPLYSALVEKNDGKRVIVGSEYGVYSTSDITAGNPVWTSENGVTDLHPNSPVLKLRQQLRPGTDVYNPGVIYSGTHGRGAFKSNRFIESVSVGINEQNPNVKNITESGILVYPNPLSDEATIAFNLGNSTEIVVSVYSIQGKLAKTFKTGRLSIGDQKITLPADDLSKGTYFVTLDGINIHASTKIVVIK